MSTEPRNPQNLAILARQYANAWVWHHSRGCYVSRADYVTTTVDVATAIADQDPHGEATHDDANAVLAADYYVLTAHLLADTNARAFRDAQWRHHAYSTPDSLATLGRARLAADYSAALLHEATELARTVHEQEFLSDASPHVKAAYWAALNPGPVSLDDALGVLWRDAANIAVHQSAIDYGNDGSPEADHALPTTQRTRQETSIDLIAHHTGLPRSFIHQEITTAADAYHYAPGTDNDPDYLGPPDWHDLATRYTPLSGQPTAPPEAHTVAEDNPEGEPTHQQTRDTPTSPGPDEIQRVCDYLASREPHRDPDALWDHAEHLVELGYTAQTLTEWNTQLDAYLADEKTILRESEKRHQLFNYLAQQHPTWDDYTLWTRALELTRLGYTAPTGLKLAADTTDNNIEPSNETTPDADAPIAALAAQAEDITSRPPAQHDDNARKLQRLANELTLTRALLESGELPDDDEPWDHADDDEPWDYADDDEPWDHAERLAQLGYTAPALVELDAQTHTEEPTEGALRPATAEELARQLTRVEDHPDWQRHATHGQDGFPADCAFCPDAADREGLERSGEQAPHDNTQTNGTTHATASDDQEGWAQQPSSEDHRKLTQLADELNQARALSKSGEQRTEQQNDHTNNHDQSRGSGNAWGAELEAHERLGSDPDRRTPRHATALASADVQGREVPLPESAPQANHGDTSRTTEGPPGVNDCGEPWERARRAVTHLDAHLLRDHRVEGLEPPPTDEPDLGW